MLILAIILTFTALQHAMPLSSSVTFTGQVNYPQILSTFLLDMCEEYGESTTHDVILISSLTLAVSLCISGGGSLAKKTINWMGRDTKMDEIVKNNFKSKANNLKTDFDEVTVSRLGKSMSLIVHKNVDLFSNTNFHLHELNDSLPMSLGFMNAVYLHGKSQNDDINLGIAAKRFDAELILTKGYKMKNDANRSEDELKKWAKMGAAPEGWYTSTVLWNQKKKTTIKISGAFIGKCDDGLSIDSKHLTKSQTYVLLNLLHDNKQDLTEVFSHEKEERFDKEKFFEKYMLDFTEEQNKREAADIESIIWDRDEKRKSVEEKYNSDIEAIGEGKDDASKAFAKYIDENSSDENSIREVIDEDILKGLSGRGKVISEIKKVFERFTTDCMALESQCTVMMEERTKSMKKAIHTEKRRKDKIVKEHLKTMPIEKEMSEEEVNYNIVASKLDTLSKSENIDRVEKVKTDYEFNIKFDSSLFYSRNGNFCVICIDSSKITEHSDPPPQETQQDKDSNMMHSSKNNKEAGEKYEIVQSFAKEHMSFIGAKKQYASGSMNSDDLMKTVIAEERITKAKEILKGVNFLEENMHSYIEENIEFESEIRSEWERREKIALEWEDKSERRQEKLEAKKEESERKRRMSMKKDEIMQKGSQELILAQQVNLKMQSKVKEMEEYIRKRDMEMDMLTQRLLKLMKDKDNNNDGGNDGDDNKKEGMRGIFK